MIFTISKFIIRILLSLFYKIQPYGVKEHFISGPAIVAANHSSFLDPLVIPLSVPGKIYHLARSTLFNNAFTKWVLTKWACYPVNREKGSSAAFKAAFDLFQQKEKLIIYPEGTRNSDGQIQQGKVGVGMLAIKSGVPVIPVYVGGTFEAFSRNQKFPKIWRRLVTVFGKPLTFEDLIQNETVGRKEAYQLATQRIMDKIAELKAWYENGCVGNIP